jgi:hypothetical protein
LRESVAPVSPDPDWSRNGADAGQPVDQERAGRRGRAAAGEGGAHRRSLQDELLAIVEDAVRQPEILTAAQVLAEARRLGVTTPTEAAAMIHEDRDAR